MQAATVASPRSCSISGIKPEIWSLHSEFPEHLEEMHSARLCIVGKLLAPTLKLRSSMAMANLAALTRLKSKKYPYLQSTATIT